MLAVIVGLAVAAGQPVTLEDRADREFEAIAARGDVVHRAWAHYQRGGYRYVVDGETVGEGTGPPRLAVGPDGWLLAHADRDGDLAVTTAEGTRALTTEGPRKRYEPLAVTGEGLVLVREQKRRRTTLRLIGPSAPARPIHSMPAVSDISGSVAATTVVYERGRSVWLARPEGDGWRRKRLGRGEDPSVVIARGRAIVAWRRGETVRIGARRYRGGGTPFLARGGARVFAAWLDRVVRVR